MNTFTPTLLRRRQMMMSKSKPYDAEIEYLEGGNQPYIDSLINTSNLLDFECEIQIVNPISNIQFGGRYGSLNKSNALFYNKNTSLFYYRYDSANYSLSVQSANSYLIETYKGSVTINGDTISYTPKIFDAQTTFCLFACKNHGGSLTGDLSVGLRMKWIKLYYDDTLVRDFIPVRVGQVGYMYDKVSGQLFGNQGTGNFILGPDKTE